MADTITRGFADITISTNLARDLGCRCLAAIFFGGEVFSYHNYSWIAILVNVPATLFATAYYELLLRDSLQKLGKGAAVHEHGEEALTRHLTRQGIIEGKYRSDSDDVYPPKSTENGFMQATEHVDV